MIMIMMINYRHYNRDGKKQSRLKTVMKKKNKTKQRLRFVENSYNEFMNCNHLANIVKNILF